ncbi:MAG: class I SAM-dependent methyltransferase [Flavobacteriales bacterium]|nr:class I SAM-dependent methyltransferase [Flavobacteriales bacterium]
MSTRTYQRWSPSQWAEYEILDSGDGARLERFGPVVLERPDPGAMWPRRLTVADWDRANAHFEPTGKSTGYWVKHGSAKDRWNMNYKSDRLNLTFQLEMTKFKHVGLFPEQAENWEYIAEHLKPGNRFLNLFAYTGGASIAARAAGADVTHVDAIRQVIDWTRVNMELSGLDGIRWVVEDALKFAEREQKRGNTYDGIVLDPPTWGLGPKGEKWRLEDQLTRLCEAVADIVSPNGFIIMNTYSGISPTALETLWSRLLPTASSEVGELCLEGKDGHLIPTGSLIRLKATS